MRQPALSGNQEAAFPQQTHSVVQQSAEEKIQEARRIRRLQFLVGTVMQAIQENRFLSVEQASAMVADVRQAALTTFPDKALAFDLIYWPRLQRLMRARYRMQ